MLVDYLTQANLLFRSDVRPSDREQIYVMESGKLRAVAESENPVDEIRIQYPEVQRDDLAAIRDFVRNNRRNLIKFTSEDRQVYICKFTRRSVRRKHISGQLYEVTVVMRGGEPTVADHTYITSFENAPPTNDVGRLNWQEAESNGIDIDGYQIRHRVKGQSEWTVETVAGANTLTLDVDDYARGTFVDAQVRAYHGEDPADRSYAAWSLTVNHLIGGDAGKPTLSVFPGDGNAVASWMQPDTYGSPVIQYHVRYRVVGSGGAYTTLTTNELSLAIAGLVNGTNYEFEVAAETEYGVGAYSDPVQGQPESSANQLGGANNPIEIANPLNYTNTNVTSLVRAGHGSVNATYFDFVVPRGNSGDYTITLAVSPSSADWNLSEHDGDPASVSPNGNESITITANAGATVTFRIWANDADAAANATQILLSITANTTTVPGAPASLSVSPGDTIADGTATPPTNNGGSTITGYRWRLDGGTHVDTTGRTHRWTGLNKGTRYLGEVAALNARGSGAFRTQQFTTHDTPYFSSGSISPSASVFDIDGSNPGYITLYHPLLIVDVATGVTVRMQARRRGTTQWITVGENGVAEGDGIVHRYRFNQDYSESVWNLRSSQRYDFRVLATPDGAYEGTYTSVTMTPSPRYRISN